MGFLIRIVINAVALWLATVIVPGVNVETDGSTGDWVLRFLVIALIFGLVNAVVKPIAKVLSFPAFILTLGLFTFVLNALMLWLTSWITQYTPFVLHVDGFWAAVFGALVISIVSFVLSLVTPDGKSD